MLRIVVCVSGGGTNLQAILDAMDRKEITDVRIVGVLSNNPGAYALERARMKGIEGICISPKEFADRTEFEAAMLQQMNIWEPDLIVLAGFLVNIPVSMVENYQDRIINIHPSLIPSFCGKGYYGLKVHEGVLERGVKVTGATVHFVDTGTDTGPIILQKAVEVRQDDTPKQLQQRVMEEAEWVILPKAINLIAKNQIVLKNGQAKILE